MCFCCYLLQKNGFFWIHHHFGVFYKQNHSKVPGGETKDGRQTWRCSQDIFALRISMYRLEILPWYCRFWSLDNWRGTFSKDLSKLAILRINTPLLIQVQTHPFKGPLIHIETSWSFSFYVRAFWILISNMGFITIWKTTIGESSFLFLQPSCEATLKSFEPFLES